MGELLCVDWAELEWCVLRTCVYLLAMLVLASCFCSLNKLLQAIPFAVFKSLFSLLPPLWFTGRGWDPVSCSKQLPWSEESYQNLARLSGWAANSVDHTYNPTWLPCWGISSRGYHPMVHSCYSVLQLHHKGKSQDYFTCRYIIHSNWWKLVWVKDILHKAKSSELLITLIF